MIKPIYPLLFCSIILSACSRQSLPIDPNPKPPQFNQPIQNVIPTSPSGDTFSSQHLIQTTFVPQAPDKNWDQPWQDTCEEAALLTPHYFYQNQTPNLETIKQDLLSMLDYEHQQGWDKDINLSQMAQIAQQHLNYQTEIIDHPSLDQIKQFIAKDIPVIIPANGKTLFAENPHFRNGGPDYHNLTILGYDDTTNQFIVHDVGTQFGAYFRYSYQLLLSSIHDLPATGKQDITSGIPRVLILLK